jgi:hypothetical protein
MRQVSDVLPTDPSQERRGIAAVVEPVLLLPAEESGRPLRYLLHDHVWHIVGHAPADVGELSWAAVRQPEIGGGCAVRNAPQTKDLRPPPGNGPLVPEAGWSAADVTHVV